MADPSMILICLVFSLYPFTAAVKLGDFWVSGLAAGFLLAGVLAELVLLCRGKRGFWVPALCAGALAVLEALYQLEQFHITHMITGHDVWWAVFFGVAVLYVLVGAALGWLGYLACQKRRMGQSMRP